MPIIALRKPKIILNMKLSRSEESVVVVESKIHML
jgi:hypothetical protein